MKIIISEVAGRGRRYIFEPPLEFEIMQDSRRGTKDCFGHTLRNDKFGLIIYVGCYIETIESAIFNEIDDIKKCDEYFLDKINAKTRESLIDQIIEEKITQEKRGL